VTFIYALRYLQIVSLVPPLFVTGFVITVAAAAVRLMSDPGAAVEALTPVLLLQLFVASSGFQHAARRGYYDLLLTSGTPRWQIAVAHCLVSVMPGIVSWMCVGLLELAASHGSHFVSGAAGTCVAFAGMSIIAWSTAVFTSRATAAVGWLLAMTIPPVARVASPLQLLGVTTVPSLPRIIVALAIASVPVAMAFTRIIRGTTPLEASQ
jgi:hypothetical protein